MSGKEASTADEKSGFAGFFSLFSKKTPEKKRKKILINSWEDVPSDLKESIKSAKIDVSHVQENLPHFLCVASFVLKKKYIFVGQERKKLRDVAKDKYNMAVREIGRNTFVEVENIKKLYKFSEQAGKGGYGKVFEAKESATGRLVALKKITKDSVKYQEMEVGALKSLKHPNIVEFVTAHRASGTTWVVMEFLEGGPLSAAVESFQFSEAQIAYFTKEILKGLSYMHNLHYVHRDIKSDNIMLSVDAKIKIVDFGLVASCEGGKATKLCGSPFWMAPEMISKQPYSYAVDIWSFGVVVMEMIDASLVHKYSKLKHMWTVASKGINPDLVDIEKLSCDSRLKEFLSMCLTHDQEKRPTAEQLSQHPFLEESSRVTDADMKNLITSLFVANTLRKMNF
eukprot:TRINITY_DN4413_c0_g1_i1.p1 TRINITY_DN4413_c0_g1~~TRINITY_DN4413_c0_g1_i1.p1  ORF type:complete len:407 (-),score=49.84 TRINITY_DN4413_c0_g1_i1:292-1482(-)